MALPCTTGVYTPHVLKNRTDTEKVAYYKYWGAIGDFYYFLAFIAPLLRRDADHRRVLVTDTYPRYGGSPVTELAAHMNLIDEVWNHPRRGGGPNCFPQEMFDQYMKPSPDVKAYTPGIYYDAYIPGPGGTEYPLEWLRNEALMNPKYLGPVAEKRFVMAQFSQLEDVYITVQPDTMGKSKKEAIPGRFLKALSCIDVQKVVLFFPTDRKRIHKLQEMCNFLDGVFVGVKTPVESLAVQAYAACHVGVESSQLLGAAIQDVRSFFFPVNGCSHFARDLALSEIWSTVGWESDPAVLRSLVANEVARAKFQGA